MLIKRAASGDYTSVARAAWGGFGLELHDLVTIKNISPRTGGVTETKINRAGKSKQKNAPNGAFLNG